jgi:microcystin-dependent protein
VKKVVFLSAAAVCALCSAANATSDPYVGEMMVTAADFCPVGWLPMNGQLLQIAAYPELHAVIGNVYGGDNVSNFAAPMGSPIFSADHRQFLSCIASQGATPVLP